MPDLKVPRTVTNVPNLLGPGAAASSSGSYKGTFDKTSKNHLHRHVTRGRLGGNTS